MASGHMIEVHRLRREFKRRRREARVALADLDMAVAAGEVHGLLGPNGAGKTTLCKILATVLIPTAGTARIAGFDVVADVDKVRRTIGIVFGGERGLYGRLTARQNLMYWSALYRQPTREARPRVEALLERVGLRERANERVETFSRGMKQRLHLARGLVSDPRVVILDEPTVGMDPVASREFRGLVEELRGDGRTVLLTTHDMAEAETVCDRVSLIDGGELLGTEDPRTIGRWLSTFENVTAEDVSPELAAALERVAGVERVTRQSTGAVLVETSVEGASREVLQALLSAGVTKVSTTRPSLEAVYLHVIGDRGLRIR